MVHPAIIKVSTPNDMFIYGPYEKAEAERLAQAINDGLVTAFAGCEAEAESLVTLDDAGLLD